MPNIEPISTAPTLSRPAPTRIQPTVEPKPAAQADRVELSPRASDPAFRAELVEQIKSEIARGTYDEQAKLSAAIPRLIQDLTA